MNDTYPKHVWGISYARSYPTQAIYCILERIGEYYRVKKLLSWDADESPYAWSLVQTVSTVDFVVFSDPVTDEDLAKCYEAHLNDTD